MRIAIDPGHGMGASALGRYDPGAVAKDGETTFEEADIALSYSHDLGDALKERGQQVWFTRQGRNDPSLTSMRARHAEGNACEMLVSVHLNAFTDPAANGTECLYNEYLSKATAERCSAAVATALGFKDRGAKRRYNLAVLKFRTGRSVLIEIGFISNRSDRATMLDPLRRKVVAQALAGALLK